MSNLTRNLAIAALLGALAAGPAFGSDDEDHKANDGGCTPASASAQRGETGDFNTGPSSVAEADGAAGPQQKTLAGSPIPWQPGNPFRDDTAA